MEKKYLSVQEVVENLNDYRSTFSTCVLFSPYTVQKVTSTCDKILKDFEAVSFDGTKQGFVNTYIERIKTIKKIATDFGKDLKYTPAITAGQSALSVHPKSDTWYVDVIGSFESATDIFEEEIDSSGKGFFSEGEI